MSDRIGVMDDGRLLQVGTPEGDLRAPSVPVRRRFIGDINLITGTVSGPDRVRLANGQEIECAHRKRRALT